MLIAQTNYEELTLITDDPVIQQHPARILR